MANLVGIIDPVSDRRNQFVTSVKTQLKIFPWLQSDEIHHGHTSIAWAAIPSAPVFRWETDEHTAGFVLGNPDDECESCFASNPRPSGCAHWQRIEDIASRSGFFMACTWEPSGAVALATDLLGLFPLYYCSTEHFLLFSTSFSLFRNYPAFSAEINPRGLAGILLTMHIVGNQTLLNNVRRIPMGHILRWQEGKGSREIPISSLRPTSIGFGDPYQDHLARFDDLMQKTLSTASRNHGALLLSGGLDSRLMAGYLGKMPIGDPKAISLGDKDDNEVKFAARVAEAIGWPHVRVGVQYARFPEFARKLVEIEQVSNGFADLAFFQASEEFHAIAPTIMTGFAGDIVMGGSHVRAGYDTVKGEHSFDAKFRAINRYGFPPNQIKQLVRPDFLGNCLVEVLQELRQEYYSIEGLPFQRTWMFDMMHRVRFHTAASIAWRLSFSSWPIMPYINRQILEAAFGMPEETLIDRRAQIDLLCRNFPLLAALPLERLTLDTTPLLTSPFRRHLALLMQWSHFHRRKQRIMRMLGIPGHEMRSYFKTFDINNEGWMAVRDDAEQYRRKAEHIFCPEVLMRFLPPPHIPIHVPQATVDSSRRKLLLALTLWAGGNL